MIIRRNANSNPIENNDSDEKSHSYEKVLSFC